jgi:hypothetical protein
MPSQQSERGGADIPPRLHGMAPCVAQRLLSVATKGIINAIKNKTAGLYYVNVINIVTDITIIIIIIIITTLIPSSHTMAPGFTQPIT